MIQEVLLLIFGLPLILFLPGYLLTVIVLEELETFKKFLVGIGFSMVITILLSFGLSFIGNIIGSKGLTPLAMVISLVVISVIFIEIILIRAKQRGL